MRIRFIDGPRKGEVCDVLPHTAEHLCNVNMAVDASDTEAAKTAVVPVAEVAIDPPPAPVPPPKPKHNRNKKAKRSR